MGTRAASGPAILFCGGQQVTTRRAWQTEAHPRYGVTRGEELGLEADRAGSGWDTVNKGKAAGQARMGLYDSLRVCPNGTDGCFCRGSTQSGRREDARRRRTGSLFWARQQTRNPPADRYSNASREKKPNVRTALPLGLTDRAAAPNRNSISKVDNWYAAES